MCKDLSHSVIICFLYVLMMVFLAVMPACDKETPPPPPEPEHFENVVLVYAASANNLYGNMLDDKSEMLRGLSDAVSPNCRLMLYETVPASGGKERSAVLYEAKKSGKGDYVFKAVKEYPATTFTTDPDRLAEVIRDVRDKRPSDRYGLMFWSHGGGWEPGFTDHEYPKSPVVAAGDPSEDEDRLGMAKWWGVDAGGGISDKMDIDELADALPDGCFDFIWFDCCYMSCIELAYQLRHKTRYFVAYPTEVYSPGLDYSAAIPELLKPVADLPAAAKTIYDYYTYRVSYAPAAVTIGVFDLSVIEEVAAVARRAYSGYVKPETSGLQQYTRTGVLPAYDFRQSMLASAVLAGNTLDSNNVDDVFRRFTVCKYASERDFNGRLIESEKYCGMSAHIYNPDSFTASERFYRSLDWFKAAYVE